MVESWQVKEPTPCAAVIIDELPDSWACAWPFRTPDTPENPLRLGPMDTLSLSASEFESIVHELLEGGRSVRFRASGQSMEPFVRDGDRVVADRVAIPDLRPGDVILYRRGSGNAAAHRLVRWADSDRETAVVAADAGFTETETVPAADILGRVESSERESQTRRLDTNSARFCGLLWFRTRAMRRIVRRLGQRCRLVRDPSTR